MSVLDRLAVAARRVEAKTPDDRNRVVDLLRGAAITVVVLGHWTIVAVYAGGDDPGIQPHGVLDRARWTHPLTWIFQVMPIFFLVGGYANALSWRSARGRGDSYAGWLRARLQRLGGPVVPLLVTWLVLASTAYSMGVPGSMLRVASQVALVPTWFLAAYVLVVAVAPATLLATGLADTRALVRERRERRVFAMGAIMKDVSESTKKL